MFLTRSEYDRGVNTFSPEGRLFQVEYAIEAIKLGSTAIGVWTKEGVVLAVEKRITSPLLEPKSIEKVMEIDSHIGCAMSGLTADARTLIEHARVQTQANPRAPPLNTPGKGEGTMAKGHRPFHGSAARARRLDSADPFRSRLGRPRTGPRCCRRPPPRVSAFGRAGRFARPSAILSKGGKGPSSWVFRQGTDAEGAASASAC
uniref:Proteasome subunit alpha type n=1 Tax=Tetraselmis sp. GSL018 TaxID=582737 RepID=A0A061QUN9_9CHLO